MNLQRFKTYRKNNFPGISRGEVEKQLREQGFCKTVQKIESPAILSPSELAEDAISNFEDLDTFLEISEVVYYISRRMNESSIVVFYK